MANFLQSQSWSREGAAEYFLGMARSSVRKLKDSLLRSTFLKIAFQLSFVQHFLHPMPLELAFLLYSNLYKVYFMADDTTMLIATSTETAWLPMATIEVIPPQCIDNFYSVGRDLILAYDWRMEKLANITCYPPAASMWWNQKAQSSSSVTVSTPCA